MKDKNDTFFLTEDDKLRYLNEIQNYDLSKKSELLSIVPDKHNAFLIQKWMKQFKKIFALL